MVRKAGLGHSWPGTLPRRLKGALSLTRGARLIIPLCFLLAWLAAASGVPFALAESPGARALLLKSVNSARQEGGVAPLQRNQPLDIAALAQARHLAGIGRLSHLGPNGERLGARLQAVGYDFAGTAENLAVGPLEAARVTALWRQSPGHNRNLLHADYSEAGIGIANSPEGDYWVIIFARPR